MSEGDHWDSEGSKPEFNPIAQVLRLAADPTGVVKRRWIWMAATLVLCVVATVFVVRSLKPEFTARARVLITGQQIPEDFVRSTVREGSLENVNAMIGEMLSRHNLLSLIETHQLYLKEREAQAINDVIDGMRRSVSIRKEPTPQQQRNARSEIFGISFTYGDPTEAATIANEFASRFVEASIQRRSQQASYTTEFLKRELSRSERELREINGEISEFQRKHRGELPGDLAPSLARLERFEQQRQALLAQISEREDRILVLSGAKESPEASAPESEMVTLRIALARELGINTEEHPNVIALKRRIELMETEYGQVTQVNSASSDQQARIEAEEREIGRLREGLTELDGTIGALDSRVDRIPARTEELTALEERARVLRENYLEFLRNVQDAELAETLESAQQGPRVQVLDRAQKPNAPTRPPLVFLLMGLAGSLVAALGIAVLFELVDPIVLSTDQLEDLTGTPALGSLPRI